MTRKKTIEKKQLFYSPCYARKEKLCFQQFIKINSFTSYQTGQTFKIFHQLDCKSYGLIYLLQCQICHLQYIGKSETVLTYNSTVIGKTEKQNAILLCQHFKVCHHNFQRDAKFKLIEKIKKPEQQNRTATTYSKKNEKTLDTRAKTTSSRLS